MSLLFNRDKYVGLRLQFEIFDIPSIIVIVNKQYYMFKENVTVANLTSFVKRKYKLSKGTVIEAPKTSMQKVFTKVKFNLASFLVTFDNLGFDYLPPPIKKCLLGFFLLLPIIIPLLCLYYTKEESIKEPDNEKLKID